MISIDVVWASLSKTFLVSSATTFHSKSKDPITEAVGFALRDGLCVGSVDGFLDGSLVGSFDGYVDGSVDGSPDGYIDGVVDGKREGNEELDGI